MAFALALVCLLAFGGYWVASGERGSKGPDQPPAWRVTDAKLTQSGRDLTLTLRTEAPVPLAKLRPRPDIRRASDRYLCLAVAEGDGARELCLGGKQAHDRLGMVVVDADEKAVSRGSIGARVKRREPRVLVVSFDPGRASIENGRHKWRVLSSGGCEERRRCAMALPDDSERTFRVRPVRAVTCTSGGAELYRNGPRNRKVVALTFDDGPSSQTPEFLRVLREHDALATFYQVGSEVPGHGETMRRILRDGHEIANHTMNHVHLPGTGQIADANYMIEEYTGFKPCTFRPPGGVVNAGLVATAGALGMSTVMWDVDPHDWTGQSPGAIAAHVVANVKPGSIVVMHDGGGNRSSTLAALPEIFSALRARGYRFTTVTDVLGGRMVYKPHG